MTELVRTVCLVALLVSGCGSSGQHTPAPAQLALVDVSVVDATSERARDRMTIIVSGGRIETVGPVDEIEIPAGTPVFEGGGRFVIPGLWDMHTHIWDADTLFPIHLANGITGIRDMGSRLEEWRSWREQVATGERSGPTAVVAGRIIDALEPLYFGWVEADHAEEARETVDLLAAGGTDFLKIYDRISADVFEAIIDGGKQHGLPVVGHVPTEVPAADAARAGMKSMEHLIGIALECSSKETELRRDALEVLEDIRSSERPQQELYDELGRYYELVRYAPQSSYDGAKAAALFEVLRDEGVWQVPTLVVRRVLDDEARQELESQLRYFPSFIHRLVMGNRDENDEDRRRSVERFMFRKMLVRELHLAGVGLLAGSDGGNPGAVPGFSLHDELELLVESGLSTREALACATLNPAIYLGERDYSGTVEPGKIADLVLLDRNPLEDIRNTRSVHAVILGGHLLSRNRLDEMLASVLNPTPIESSSDAEGHEQNVSASTAR